MTAFLQLPLTLGTGANIQAFLTRVQQLRTVRDSVSTFLGISPLLELAGLGISYVEVWAMGHCHWAIGPISMR